MKQYPSFLKYKKYHFVNNLFFSLKAQKSFYPLNGLFCIKAIDSGKLTFKQIEACRKSVRRNMRKDGRIWLNVFTYLPITTKGVGSRMGKGKGGHSGWICPIKKGQILCEASGVSSIKLVHSLKRSKSKLGLTNKIFKLTY